jgi:glycosyltransferase involved in cell wall biosynthesis
MTPPFTVLIPAHNEEASIGRTLRSMGAGKELPADVIVVCSGCSDRTAQVVRESCPQAQVIEEFRPGKWLAINVGLDHAPPGAVLVVDADIEVSATSLTALAEVLAQPGVAAASPQPRFDLDEVSGPVRAYYRHFLSHLYLATGTGGAGVYGLSAEARAQFGHFPPVASDDGYLRSLIPHASQRRVSVDGEGNPVFSVVRPPRSLLELLRSEARWRRGDREVRRLLPDRGEQDFGAPMPAPGTGAVKDRLCYFAIKVLGRIYSYWGELHPDRTWRKDPSSRLPSSTLD